LVFSLVFVEAEGRDGVAEGGGVALPTKVSGMSTPDFFRRLHAKHRAVWVIFSEWYFRTHRQLGRVVADVFVNVDNILSMHLTQK